LIGSIVAIHGVGGHAFKTWTDNDGHLWLRDSLPAHVPKAGVLTYGYDSAVLFGKSKMRIHDFAVDLLSRLRFEQLKSPGKERRLIFICHSLGGLVLKQALITASLQPDQYGMILKSTYGAVFMGTPHQGSRSASLARHLSRLVNITTFGTGVRSDLLEHLELSSSTLEQLSLLSISLLKDLAIVSFYEQKPLGLNLVFTASRLMMGVTND
jgi:alpha-beta hydrolase superfamily lysophospholipase